ncbi:tyrosine-protein kinase transmembrane receptor Ror [Plodia interpunctella]|uniref:tyrosine-protein kinase transmembrane receptor Ror n=1 Tax=Plodia interpunctella TaxID=58824 RepID=UPI002368AC0D|nr:tyrosine-protein kinase transmembrane receptor Ror [Plodia interpunctella]
MKYLCVIIVLCFSSCKSQSPALEKVDIPSSTKGNSLSEQKWNIKLDINFSKNFPSILRKSLGSHARFKCEAVVNFTKVERYIKNKEGIETILKESPPEHIQQALMKNVKIYWLKNNKPLPVSPRVNVSTSINMHNSTIGVNLLIKDIHNDDKGNYSCVIKQNDKKQTTVLKIVKDKDALKKYEIPTYPPLFPNSDNELEMTVETTANMAVDSMKSQSNNQETDTKTNATHKLQPICQEYVGAVCDMYLKGQFVYIPYETTQALLEDKLGKALRVTQYSNDISSNCEGYALPSLCYSTFPICRDPIVTNDNFYKEAKQILELLSSSNSDDSDDPKIEFDNLPQGMAPLPNSRFSKNVTIELLNYRYNSTVLRRVCKQDCEILENELCQTEYAIAKRHPHIGQQLTLEECQDLPENDPDCLKIGIGTVIVSDDECYWEDGSGYLGRVSMAENGMPCIPWSKQMRLKVSKFPELAGRHSYCRNPGGVKTQPWCFVEKDGKTEQQLCDIHKCAHKIWIYIVIVFLLLTLSIIGFIICICYKHKNKNNAATIRDINLPNADKNIYGNSRLNSPIEMNELLTNQNLGNQPHLTRNTRGNGVLRIPQYSLSQIKFLEELGEGAFGKVYKGAIKKNGETQYVAVKALKENASAKTQADFRREIDLISELTHENIVCIVGVALREEPLCMLFEFMARGDLHEFLMGRAPPSGKGLPAMRLLNIANNIASGMQYLASHHYVHRDLAARNCLVSDDFVVKISDFGLSRDIYSSDYYRVQSKSLLPVRWMPPESILYGKFTTESDIWSYGVVLWEIYSYGLQPYYGFSNQEVIAMVRGGELLAAPSGCPAAVYSLMRDCWHHTPLRRPNFQEIVARIQEWIQSGGCSEWEGGREERAPLLPPHCSSSNGSLHTNSLKKFSTASSSLRMTDDARSTCSDVPPLAPKTKKHSAASLIDDRTRDTVVRIPNTQFGNEI